jgi:CIC family chloride channel protein
MGTLFAGIIRAPMTSVFMIFEITQDYQIIVPLMIANMTSLMISRRYQPEPVYRALLTQDGITLPTRTGRDAVPPPGPASGQPAEPPQVSADSPSPLQSEPSRAKAADD